MATSDASSEERPVHSGRLLVRMPQSLHAELARAAEREGVSLNALITGALAGAVGWRDQGETGERARAEHGSASGARRRWATVALAANVAVVVLAAAAAIVLIALAVRA